MWIQIVHYIIDTSGPSVDVRDGSYKKNQTPIIGTEWQGQNLLLYMYEIFTCTCNRVIHRNAQSLSSEFQRYCTICIKCRVRANLNTPPPPPKKGGSRSYLPLNTLFSTAAVASEKWMK